jgi:hypothetical protein
MGTSATVLYGNDKGKRMMCVNAPPGHADEQSSYRSELTGIEGTLALVASIYEIHDICSGSITIGLAGDQALIQASGDWSLSPSQADFDILHDDIQEKIHRLPINIHWKWIEVHQDDHAQYDDLDEWAQANILVDNVAKAYWNHLCAAHQKSFTARLGDEGWSLSVADGKIGWFDKRKLYNTVYEEDVMTYWAKKANLHRDATRSIDWELCGEALTKLTIPKQRQVTKQGTGLMSCERMMKLKERLTSISNEDSLQSELGIGTGIEESTCTILDGRSRKLRILCWLFQVP